MSRSDASPTEESLLPWGFVNLSQYQMPPESASETVRKGVLGLWDRLKWAPTKPRSPTVDINLEAVPSELLVQTAPEPDWADGVPALHKALQDWWQGRSGKVQVLVGAPNSGTAEIVTKWAAAFQCQVFPEPSLELIKSGEPPWLKEMDQNQDQVWVIPHLEWFYLRHSQGFGLLRTLIDKIDSFPGRLLLACDSWAWAYLNKVLNIETLFPPPLVLRAFDQVRLDHWFRGLAALSPDKDFVFRQADNEKLVVHLDAVSQEKTGEQEVTDFLQRLAAFSRGIPGVAYTIWRYSLRKAQEQDLEEKTKRAAAKDRMHETIWVEPWSRLELPTLPGLDPRGRDLFVLHTLLLHNGLSSPVLTQVLPFPESQTMGSLKLLRVAGVVIRDQDRWRINESTYPGVRNFLQNEGYLVDAL